jgi:hypothetical protein
VSDDAKTDETAEPPKRKKRKKKPIQAAPEPEMEEWRPGFAAHFPRDPELDDLVRAFSDGNYRRVREEASALAARTEDPSRKRAALELRERIDPPPAGVVLLVLATVLLVLLAGYYWTHKHV